MPKLAILPHFMKRNMLLRQYIVRVNATAFSCTFSTLFVCSNSCNREGHGRIYNFLHIANVLDWSRLSKLYIIMSGALFWSSDQKQWRTDNFWNRKCAWKYQIYFSC